MIYVDFLKHNFSMKDSFPPAVKKDKNYILKSIFLFENAQLIWFSIYNPAFVSDS